MRLIDLDPCWVGHGGEGVSNADGTPIPYREKVGVSFDCPSGCGEPAFIPFENPEDGGPAVKTTPNHPAWHREGDSFETLTLRPSILRRGGCGWHGFLTNGEFTKA